MKKFLSSSLLIAAAGLWMLTSCQSKPKEEAEQPTQSGLLRSNFQSEETDLYTLTNANGMEVCFTNFGGRIVSIMVPNKDGQLIDVCLGHDNIDDYIKFGNEGCNFGALIGRYGNRIGNAKFTLDGQEYQLIANNNMNSLHGGGPVAFHNRIWEANQVDNQTLEFTTTSPDGEDGYPGNISVKVTYKLGDDNSLAITYQGSTDKPTVLNLTNHCYFCLSGDPTKDALDEVLYLNANQYTPVDEYVLATGEIADVEGTPFDFRTPTRIGDRIDDTTNVQIKNGNGYDHNWILATNGDINAVAGTLYDPTSGVQMDMYTDQPGMQFYAGTSSTAASSARKASPIPDAAPSASRPSTIPTAPTILSSPPPHSFQVRNTTQRPSISSA